MITKAQYVHRLDLDIASFLIVYYGEWLQVGLSCVPSSHSKNLEKAFKENIQIVILSPNERVIPWVFTTSPNMAGNLPSFRPLNTQISPETKKGKKENI